MCSGFVKEALFKYLKKGTFPGFSQSELPLWNCLLQLLEKDADGTVAEINKALLYPDDFSNVIEVNKVVINTGLTDTATFLGYAHARLCADHALATRDAIQNLIQRLRVVATAKHALVTSSVTLTADPGTHMGHGLVANPLTYIPD